MFKINDDFYKSDNYYNKDIYGDYKDDIRNYINKYKKEQYNQIVEEDKRTNIANIFSEMRSNIIKWYTFDENKKILEIGANYGEITQELVKRCNAVTAIEFSKEKAECIAKRLKDAENLKVILCSDLRKIELKDKYDYITLIGTAEYAKKIGFKDLKELIRWSYENLTENGKIFLAIDNKFGAKYLAGSTRNKEEVPFANYKSYVSKDYELYGKSELEEILKQGGYIYKFYYPVPNYNLTHLIYTDNYLPKQNRYNIYYREDEEILFNELTLIEEATKNKKFDFFTNSYLIEITKNKDEISDKRFVNFSNMRKQEYKIITAIASNSVSKKAYRTEGIPHIHQIANNIEKLKELGLTICEESQEDEIVSNYILKPTIDEFLIDLLKENKIEEFYQELDKWYNFIRDKFSETVKGKTIFEKYEIEISNKENLTFLKDGFIDLIFQNVFYDGNEYILFDQEWYEENVPIEFIMYRSIKQLFFQHGELEKIIDKEKIYLKYNIYSYINQFDKLEEEWQNNMVNKDIYSFYKEKWNRMISIEDIKFNYNQELGKIYMQRDELEQKIEEQNDFIEKIQKKYEKEIKDLNYEKSKMQNEINGLKSRKFYKLANFLSRRKKKDE